MFDIASTAYTKLKQRTTGTAEVNPTYDTNNNSLQLTWQQVATAVAEIGETDQTVTVAVDCTPLYDAINGISRQSPNATRRPSANESGLRE